VVADAEALAIVARSPGALRQVATALTTMARAALATGALSRLARHQVPLTALRKGRRAASLEPNSSPCAHCVSRPKPVRQKSTGFGRLVSARDLNRSIEQPLGDVVRGGLPVGPSQHCTYILVNSTETGTPLFGPPRRRNPARPRGSFPVGVTLKRTGGILDPSTVSQKPTTFAGHHPRTLHRRAPGVTGGEHVVQSKPRSMPQ